MALKGGAIAIFKLTHYQVDVTIRPVLVAPVSETPTMKKLALIVYGIFGAVAIVFGLATLLFPAAMQTEAAQSIHLAHNLREQAAAIIFVGLMAFWCIFNYQRRTLVHAFLTIFTFLIAGIHWFDYFGGRLPWMSPLYNSVPFLVFLVLAIFDRKREAVL